MLDAQHAFKAQAYRRKAKTCGNLACCAQSASDREQLLSMRDTCLSLAANEDRLDGLPPLPPVHSNALMVPRHA